ncbi:hypothetical protein ACSQ67_009780 [Phaseolus vulgaris]
MTLEEALTLSRAFSHHLTLMGIAETQHREGAALAAQFAAEATLLRVHAAQKDDERPLIEAIIAPLEAKLNLLGWRYILISMLCIELIFSWDWMVAKLQDDNRALDRLTKSKEAAVLEAEITVQIALAEASLVDDLQNKNQELMKQIEKC